jgi:hypothetical protein
MENRTEVPEWNRYDSIKSLVALGQLALQEIKIMIGADNE